MPIFDRRFRDMMLMDYNLKNQGGLLSGQQGATGGLLGGLSNISPDLLIGANILGQGLQGTDPFSAVTPAITQGIQTSSLIDQLNRSKKTQKFIEDYKSKLPEGSTLKTLFEVSPDAALDFISKSELAKVNAEGQRTTAVKNAVAIGLQPGTKEFNDYVKAQTVRTDVAAQALAQQGGLVVGTSQRDEIVKDLRYVSQIRNQLDVIKDKINLDPSLVGGLGATRRAGNKIGSLLKDIGVDVEKILPEGIGKEFIFDKDIPTLSALENTLAAGYAKVLYPGQKITNQQINQAKEIVNLTGFTGSEEVINRIDQLGREMDVFINTNKNLLGDSQKKYRINLETGELEEY